MHMFKLAIVLTASMLAAACARELETATPVFPDMPAPTQNSRAYGLTESPDGAVRVFAQEDYGNTNLFYSLKTGDEWSAPQKLDVPARKTATSPSFSPVNGHLYFSSDAAVDDLPGRKDLNIWQLPRENGSWGVATPLPVGNVNTGANELSPAIDGNGVLYYASTHSRTGFHGSNIVSSSPQPDGDWTFETPFGLVNDDRANEHLAVTKDGQMIFFYSHRRPKFGSTDIWVSKRGESGDWNPPERLGKTVNSTAIEFGAGLSSDNKTFFFSRDGQLMQIDLNAALANLGEPVDTDEK